MIHSFTLVLQTPTDMTIDKLSELVYPVASDGLVGCAAGEFYIDYDRESVDRLTAAHSAVQELKGLGFNIKRLVMDFDE
jgi:hypothetical protein